MLRFVVGVERADVAPVLRRLLVLVVEAVGVDRRLVDQRRDDVLAEVVIASAAPASASSAWISTSVSKT